MTTQSQPGPQSPSAPQSGQPGQPRRSRRAMRSGPRPDNHVIVLFGATGDLAKRKLLPGMFHLAAAGLMPERYRIIGSAPAKSAMTDEAFREHARQAAEQFGTTKPGGAAWDAFAANLSFGSADAGNTAPLAHAVAAAEKEIGGAPRLLFHLAVPPAAFEGVVAEIGAMGLAPGARVIIEKPFGTDLASAQDLDRKLHAVFDESQIFRIDHFLGKESVDNILALRFANGLFEPVWNRQHIRYVQIDVPETLSIEGRAAFYDSTGAYRDMIVTHLFQVLGFVAMEPPSSLDARALKEEKAKVYDGLRPIDVRHVVRGQYEGYRSEPGVPPDSQTETMVALRAEVDNWRWAGVPSSCGPGRTWGRPAGDHARVRRAAAADVPHRAAGRPRGLPERARHRLRRPRVDHRPVPGQGTRRGDGSGRGDDGVPLPGLLHRGQRAGGV